MINRLKNLVLLQLGGRFKFNRITDRKKFVIATVMRTVGIIAICVLIYALLFAIKSFLYIPINNNMMLFCLFISQILSLLACTVGLSESLYTSKDNPILLAYPAKHSEVFVSKLIVFYILEFLKNLYFLLPILLSFGLILKVGFGYWVFAILMFALLPLLATFFGAVVSIPLLYIKKFLSKARILYFILIVGVFVGVFYLTSKMLGSIPQPLRIRALYNTFLYNTLKFIDTSANYTLFYRFVTNVLFGNRVALNLLYFLLVLVGLIFLAFFLSRPLFFSLASNSGENARIKKHKHESKPSKSVYFAFLKKEFVITMRKPGRLLENYILIILLPFVMYVFNFIYSAINLNGIGETLVIVVNLLIGLCMITASNGQSATSLSVEGGEFVLLKTAPSKTYLVAWAKITINIIISTVFIILDTLILNFFGIIAVKDLLFLFAVYEIIDIGHILWCFQLDLRNPQLRDYASSGNLQNNTNVSTSIMIGFICSFLVSLVFLLFFLDNAESYIFKTLAVCLGFLLARVYLFRSNLKVYFKEIEF